MESLPNDLEAVKVYIDVVCYFYSHFDEHL